MTFRVRVLVAGAALALTPLAILAFGVRRETRARLAAQYRQQGEAVVARAHDALRRESERVGQRLTRLCAAIVEDNRFRLSLSDTVDRAWLLEYAGRAMRLADLDVLQVQGADGRILSSGHFRNDYDRPDAATPNAIAGAGPLALLQARTAQGPLLVLARVDSVALAGQTITLVGGRVLDAAFLAGLGDSAVALTLQLPGEARPDTGTRAVVNELALPIIDPAGATNEARLVATASLGDLAAMVQSLDRWFAIAVLGIAAGSLLLAAWLASRLSGPLTQLAEKTARLDLDRLDEDFRTEREDEVGALARILGALTARLRSGAARLREAERRMAVGELARQVNHDVKNGLIPMRHVVRHMAEVAQAEPTRLAAVFAERRGTLESGLEYLESLAASYARLTPRYEHAACDVNAVVRDVAAGVRERAGLVVSTALAESLPPVRGDAVMLRRIVENLVENAVESLGEGEGTVTITTVLTPQPPLASGEGEYTRVLVTVRDTGPGMTRSQLDRAFEDFFTTKPNGTGLGLSIVRRLVLDLEGTLRVETAPGKGAAFHVMLPASPPLPKGEGAGGVRTTEAGTERVNP